MSGDHSVDATVGLTRAEQLYEKVFFEYGDDSVAQLGGVHLACEQASNLLTKVLERGRLMSYMEKSTRYVAYDTRLPNGRYRYYRSPEVLASPLGARYVGDMDRLFDAYAKLLPVLYRVLCRKASQGRGRKRFCLAPGDKSQGVRHFAGAIAVCGHLQPRHVRVRPGLRSDSCCGCGRTHCPRPAIMPT